MICVRCGVHPRRPKHKWCLACHAKNMREWRKTHALSPASRKKADTRSYAGVYKRRGKLKAHSCHVCQKPAEMHHPDYNHPLWVHWLCREHHLELHR